MEHWNDALTAAALLRKNILASREEI